MCFPYLCSEFVSQTPRWPFDGWYLLRKKYPSVKFYIAVKVLELPNTKKEDENPCTCSQISAVTSLQITFSSHGYVPRRPLQWQLCVIIQGLRWQAVTKDFASVVTYAVRVIHSDDIVSIMHSLIISVTTQSHRCPPPCGVSSHLEAGFHDQVEVRAGSKTQHLNSCGQQIEDSRDITGLSSWPFACVRVRLQTCVKFP